MNSDSKEEETIFRKRGKNKKRRRKNNARKLSVSDEKEEQQQSNLSTDVALLKKWRSRGRKSGLDVKRLMVRGEKKKEDQDIEEEETLDLTEVKKRKLDGLLKGSFSAASKNADERIDTNELLEQFVKERMGETVKKSDSNNKKGGDVDDVYRVPEGLRTAKKKKKNEESGPIAFGTGIAEVELPETYRLKNIEETELAKSRMLMGKNEEISKRPVYETGNTSGASDKRVFNAFVSKEMRSGRR